MNWYILRYLGAKSILDGPCPLVIIALVFAWVCCLRETNIYVYKKQTHVTKVMTIWHLTLKDDIDLDMPSLTIYGFVRYTCMPIIKYLSTFVKRLWVFDLWPRNMTMTLILYPSKCAASWDIYTCQTVSLYLYWITSHGQNSIFDLWPRKMTLAL